jgi:hypothetical protein
MALCAATLLHQPALLNLYAQHHDNIMVDYYFAAVMRLQPFITATETRGHSVYCGLWRQLYT